MDSLVEALQKSKSHLSSNEALRSLERDPYWPKWNSPWWHMLLWFELGFAQDIPKPSLDKMVEVLKKQYLPIFPITESEIPAGADPRRHIACHCAVGSIYQVLFAAGVDVDRELPWMRPWILKYQLPDGGLNCDERTYLKTLPKSSIVSTLPCAESILFSRKTNLTPQESAFIEGAAQYLLRQSLFRKQSSGEVIDNDWLEVRFPRFYEYDLLRGFYFLAKWRELSSFHIPDELSDEVETLVLRQIEDGQLILRRYNFFEKRSYNPQSDGSWSNGDADEFDLFKAVSAAGKRCDRLTPVWNEVKPRYLKVQTAYSVAYENPILIKAGDHVSIEKRETNPEWIGWVFCRTDRGVGGWVSERYLKITGSSAVALRDYEATELAVASGETVKSYFEEFGWYWCKNQHGKKGWVPAQNLIRSALI
jgi:hypothetical protein